MTMVKHKNVFGMSLLNNDNSLIGRADDVLGTAAGKSAGGVFIENIMWHCRITAVRLRLILMIGCTLVTQSRLINRTSIVKFGVEVGK
ncbi:DUF3833 family protein (plasmid) [Pseudoalteromonas espejiana]